VDTNTQINRDDLRLSLISRIIRLIIGILLFEIPFIQGEVSGIMAVLPLIALYPFITGILGFGLVEVMAVSNQCRSEHPPRQVKISCACLFTAGVGLIVLVIGNEILPAWLALAAIFLLLMAILGMDQVGKLLLNRRMQRVKNKTTKTIESE